MTLRFILALLTFLRTHMKNQTQKAMRCDVKYQNMDQEEEVVKRCSKKSLLLLLNPYLYDTIVYIMEGNHMFFLALFGPVYMSDVDSPSRFAAS